MRHGANEILHLVANTADFSTDDKINEGKRILNDLLASNPNNIDADWLRQMLDWGVALVSTIPPNRFEKKEMAATSALGVPRTSGMKEHECFEAIKQKWLASVHSITSGADFAAYR